MKVGVFAGKFLPPHRGHLTSILIAHSMCDKLYVVVSENVIGDSKLCSSAGLPYISGKLRKRWLCQELQNIENVEVILLEEAKYNIPLWPDGWAEWAEVLKKIVPEPFQINFGGEVEYDEGTRKYLPGIEYKLIDPTRSRWTISATEIRKNPLKHWDFILGSARPFFCKKVLFTGTESCGKTTITKKLAKIFYTSWSEELGRYYAERYLGKDESAFTDEDFARIAYLQRENDLDALSKANRVCFFDTDAIVTNYYSIVYLNRYNKLVEEFYNPTFYDVVFLMQPDVQWVDDGQRFIKDEKTRWEHYNVLKDAYQKGGFKNVVEIGGNYEDRLNKVLGYVNSMIGNK
jgi:HTH-type transcriptional repressor of NAD biosynthesis genes